MRGGFSVWGICVDYWDSGDITIENHHLDQFLEIPDVHIQEFVEGLQKLLEEDDK